MFLRPILLLGFLSVSVTANIVESRGILAPRDAQTVISAIKSVGHRTNALTSTFQSWQGNTAIITGNCKDIYEQTRTASVSVNKTHTVPSEDGHAVVQSNINLSTQIAAMATAIMRRKEQIDSIGFTAAMISCLQQQKSAHRVLGKQISGKVVASFKISTSSTTQQILNQLDRAERYLGERSPATTSITSKPTTSQSTTTIIVIYTTLPLGGIPLDGFPDDFI